MTNQDKWDEFLIDCWFNQPQAKMYTIQKMFCIDNGADHRLKRWAEDPHTRLSDVFGFVAKYLPRLSDLLLNTKKNDKERIAKIVKFAKKIDLQLNKDGWAEADKAGKKYLSKATGSCNHAQKMMGIENASRELVKDQRTSTGKTVWSQCK